jgi:hypothetical protein
MTQEAAAVITDVPTISQAVIVTERNDRLHRYRYTLTYQTKVASYTLDCKVSELLIYDTHNEYIILLFSANTLISQFSDKLFSVLTSRIF